MTTPPDLDMPAEDKAIVAELMDEHGFDSLKETQAFAFERGILEPGNDLLVAETGNGKTLTAEAVVKKHLQQYNRVAYLVPSRQLVWDKKDTLTEWVDDEYDVYSGRGKYRTADVAVGTFESFYQAIIRGVDGVRELDAIILDDFHELYGEFRGSEIELSIAAALYEDIDLYGISATLGNPEELGDWMDADVHVSPEERQTPIEETAVDVGSSSTKEGIIEVVENHPDKGPFLVFCFAKSWTESRAEALADCGQFDGPPRRHLREEFADRIDGSLTKTHREILDLLSSGVGYIHADLPGTVKRYILDLYEDRDIEAITTTTSLAYGFDSPVQTVIVADCKRRGNYVGVHEYVQWVGRAARPQHSYQKGYAFTLTGSPDETEQRFFNPHRELEPIQTHIDDDQRFRWLVLDLIANGWDTTGQLEEFIRHTLYWEQMHGADNAEGDWGQTPKPKDERLVDRLEETTAWLEDEGFVTESGTWSAYSTTALGSGAVEFNFNSFVDAPLLAVKSFYQWAESDDFNRRQLDYLHRVISDFDLALTVDTVDGPLEATLQSHGYTTDNEGITAGLIRWYWCRNYSQERIEEETGVDPMYLPGIAGKTANVIDATRHLIDAAPNATLPDWFDGFIDRVDSGVRSDALPLVTAVDGLGRARVRYLRKYLKRMAQQALDVDTDESLPTLLTAFYDHAGTDDKFTTTIEQQVRYVGPVTADNIADVAKSDDLSIDVPATEEEHALSASPTTSTTSTTSPTAENTKPTSLRDY